MRVACIGNTNHMSFSLTRYLRDSGIDCELLLLQEDRHFMPDADTFSLDYTSYTQQLDWNVKDFYSGSIVSKVNKDLVGYDIIIGSGYVPCYLWKAKRKLDVFIPHGGDLFELPFYKMGKTFIPTLNKYHKYELAKHQREAIRNATYMVMRETNAKLEQVVDSFHPKFRRIKTDIPMIYSKLYNPDTISNYYDQSHWYKEMRKIREEHDVLIFHSPRHAWKNMSNSLHNKGNDILFKGFAEFSKNNPQIKACLVTMEYGPGVADSKNLIKELNIEPKVKWFPLMFRKDLMVALSLADLGAGQFTIGGVTYGTIMESLLMGKPVMGFRDDESCKDHYPELYPILNVKTSDEITRSLEYFCSHRSEFDQHTNINRKWFQKYMIDIPLSEFIKILKHDSN
jgi:glycosyltransferase involved in cell wall biosynthesis